MSERSKRQKEIVAEMKRQALESAAAFERDSIEASRLRRIERVESVIDDLTDRLVEEHMLLLEALGVSVEEIDGRLVLEKDGKTFIVRPREDMTLAADGVIVHLNPDLPVLDDEVYEAVMGRILMWAGASGEKPRPWRRGKRTSK